MPLPAHARRAMPHPLVLPLALLVMLAGGPLLALQPDPEDSEAASERTLIVGTKVAPPFATRSESGTWDGLSIVLWRRIADELGLVHEFRETDLERLVDGLEDGRLDASVAALTVTADRERRIDFTHPFFTSGLAIAIAPAEGADRWLALGRGLLSPGFLRGVAALAVVLTIFGVLVWLFERRRNAEQFGGGVIRGVGSGFWWSAVTMTTVGYGDKAPATIGGRIVGLVWMFTSIVTISGFTAAIASTLTLQSMSLSINGPEDLPGRKVASIADSSSDEYLLRRGIDRRTYPSLSDALDAVAAGEVEAMVYDAPLLRYTVGTDYDDALTVLPDEFEPQDYAFGLPAGSDLRDEVNVAMLEIITDPSWQATVNRFLNP